MQLYAENRDTKKHIKVWRNARGLAVIERVGGPGQNITYPGKTPGQWVADQADAAFYCQK